MKHIVVIGNGIAGNSACDAIRKVNENIAITIISKEQFPEYSACLLPLYIAGKVEKEKVFLRTIPDYQRKRIDIHLGMNVEHIDFRNKWISFDDERMFYDKLIIATGSLPKILEIQGNDVAGVFTLKYLSDAEAICRYPAKNVAIMGAGMVGFKAALSLRSKGCNVFLISRRWLLPRIFDEGLSSLIRKNVEQSGIKILEGETPIKILGSGNKVTGLVTDKHEIACDMVVMATGMRPNVVGLENIRLEVGAHGGFEVNERMMTNQPDVFACGDCVAANDLITGRKMLSQLWHNAKVQGKIAGYNSAGVPKAYGGSQNIIVLNLYGISALSVGHSADSVQRIGMEKSQIETIDRKEQEYWIRLVLFNGNVIGAQLVGKMERAWTLVRMISNRMNIEQAVAAFLNKKKRLLSFNPWLYGAKEYLGISGTRMNQEGARCTKLFWLISRNVLDVVYASWPVLW